MPNEKKKILIISVGVALVMLFLFFFSMRLASGAEGWNFVDQSGLKETGPIAGYSTSDSNTVETISGKVITTTLSLVGVIFLLLMIYGGFIWMSDRGNEDKVEKAQKIIISAVIGLVLVMAAYAVSYFVVSALQTPTLEQVSPE